MDLFRRKRASTLSHGIEARAVVTEREQLVDGRRPGTVAAWRLTLRVHLPDGSTTDVRRSADASDIGSPAVGDILPVRIDPADPERVELDVPAIVAKRAAAAQSASAAAVAAAEAALTGSVEARRAGFAAEHADELAGMVARATAQIVACELAGTQGELDVVKVRLKVTPDAGGEPWETGVVLGVTAAGRDRLAPGTTYAARYDPAAPAKVKLEGW